MIQPLFKEDIRTFFHLTRFHNSLFGAFGVIVSGLLAGDLVGFQWEFLIGFLIVFFSAIGSYSFNDYFDFDVDKRNGRVDRPLVTKPALKRMALMIGVASFFVIMLLALLLNLVSMLLVLVSLPFFVFYSMGLKKYVFINNCLIAYSYVAVIFLGSLLSDGVLEPLIVYFAIMGFIVGLAIEIALDIGDLKGDKVHGKRTLPTEFGSKKAAMVSILLFGLIIIMDPLPFFIHIDPRLYRDLIFLLIILVPVVSYFLMSNSLKKDRSKDNIFRLKKRIIVTMQVGSFAYVIGVLF
jgi:4-hydroxybenzoate polyprenyltransferase